MNNSTDGSEHTVPDFENDGYSRNRFFDPPGEPEHPKRGRVYAAIEVPEREDDFQGSSEPEPAMFECVDASWFHSVQGSTKRLRWNDVYQSAPLSVLELTNYPMPSFPDNANPGDIAWFEFGYEPASSSDSDARIYTSLFSGGAAVKISFHEPRPIGWQARGPLGSNGWLAEVISDEPSSDVHDISPVLHRLRNVDCAGGVAIYDVGQGACQAALGSTHNVPQVYVDFGGGVLYNSKTFPKELAHFCFSDKPIIILSHWDWDHWSSAYRDPQALDALWLTPPAPPTPIQQAFAADLHTRGNIRIWDKSLPPVIDTGSVRIERCTGKTANDSGLAVTLRRRRRNFLLPGDAAYAHVPSVASGEMFTALCMTHHGGRLHSRVYPKPKRGHAAVLSAGPRNSYKHPLFATVAKHLEAGWQFPTPTAVSGQRPCHVYVPWGGSPHVFRGGCHATHCSVAIADIAPERDCMAVRATIPEIHTITIHSPVVA